MKCSTPFFRGRIINCSLNATDHALEHEPAVLQRRAEDDPFVVMFSCHTITSFPFRGSNSMCGGGTALHGCLTVY